MMNLTSTMLKIDLAVLSVNLGILVVVFNILKDIKKEAVRAAEERTEIKEAIKFYDRRITNVENWISGNSGFKNLNSK